MTDVREAVKGHEEKIFSGQEIRVFGCGGDLHILVG